MIKKKIYLKLLILIFFLSISLSKNLSAEQAFIALKIDNEIITNKDIEKEYRYLVTLNDQLKSLEKKKITRLAKASIINETIKKIELKKYYNLDQTSEYLNAVLKNFSIKLGLKNLDDFKKFLNIRGLTVNDLKKKLEIEAVWNEYIYNRYQKQVSVNIEDIKKNLKKEISLKKKENNSYFLYEILFQINNKENKNEKFEVIKKSIAEVGFQNTANLFSISDTAKFGGKIGWIEENKLSNTLKKEIKKLEIENYTNPLKILNGYLVLKLKNKKVVKINYDFETELKKRITIEKDRQLNQFSSIYFDKLKQNSEIYEK